mgnify:CR=1 FL=1
MKKYSVDDFLKHIGSHTVVGDPKGKYFSNIKPFDQAQSDTLVWVKSSLKNKADLIERVKADLVICDPSVEISENLKSKKCFIVVKDTRLAFLRVVKTLFQKAVEYGVHPTACIHPDAEIHKNTWIGPFAYIGNCKIGEGSIVYGNCHLYDGAEIGKNVTVHAGAVIGADGFGFQKNENGEYEKFPHIGGVIIEDDVEIGANTCIDRGALGNTVIKKGTKIDDLVYIAHNAVIGKNTLIVGQSVVSGSSEVGDSTWISPGVTIMNKVKIGSHCTIGLGAVVFNDVPDGETWMGNPALEKLNYSRINFETLSALNKSKRGG